MRHSRGVSTARSRPALEARVNRPAGEQEVGQLPLLLRQRAGFGQRDCLDLDLVVLIHRSGLEPPKRLQTMRMTLAPQGRGRRPEWRSLLPWLGPLGFLVIFLVPSGWPQGGVFLVAAVVLEAHAVIHRKSLDAGRRLLLSVLAAKD